MRALKHALVALGLLLLVPLLGLLLLIGSESGTRLLVQAAQKVVPELEIGAVQGQLLSGLTLERLHYSTPTLSLSVAQARLVPDWRTLLARRLTLGTFYLQGVRLRLPETTDPAPASTSTPLSLPDIILPMDLSLHAQFIDLSIEQGSAITRLPRIETLLQTREGRLDIERLAVNLTHSGPPDATALALLLQARGHLALRAPHDFSLDITLNRDAAPARGRVAAHLAGQPSHWQGRLELALEDLPTGAVQGQSAMSGGLDHLQLNAGALQLLDGQLSWSELALTQGDTLQMTGAIEARDLHLERFLPAGSGVSSVLLTQARLAAKAQRQKEGPLGWSLSIDTLDVALRSPYSESPPLHLSLQARAQGDGRQATINALELRQNEARLAMQGDLAWSPATRVKAHLELQEAELAPWLAFVKPGASPLGARIARLSAQLELAQNAAGQGGWSGELSLEALQGRINDQTLDAQGRLRLDDNVPQAQALRLALGQNHVALDGRLLPPFDLRGEFDVPAPQALLPVLQGQAQGRFEARGTLERLDALIEADAHRLALDGQSVERLQLTARAREGNYALEARAEGVRASGQRIEALTLQADGTLQALSARLNLHKGQLAGLDAPLEANLALQGGWKAAASPEAGGWHGQLTALRLTQAELGDWTLAGPAALKASATALGLEELCLTDAGGRSDRLCLALNGQMPAHLRAELHAQGLNLSRLSPWLPPEISLPGQARLEANFIQEAGKREAQARLTLQDAPVHVASDLARDLGALAYRDAGLSLTLHDEVLNFQAGLKLARPGAATPALARLEGEGRLLLPSTAPGPLDARLRLAIDELGIFDALSEAVDDLSGRARLDVQLSGPLDRLRLSNHLDVEALHFSVPASGVAYRVPRLSLHTEDEGRTRIEGLMLAAGNGAGEGRLTLEGWLDLRALPDWSVELAMNGEDFPVARLPEAEVDIAPRLQLRADARKARLDGRIEVPHARIDLAELPPGTVRVSGDVVIAGQEKAPAGPAYALDYALKVALGESVRLTGAGLSARLVGALDVSTSNAGLALVQGELETREARYRAYGQRLDVERGRLVFSGTLDNPGLELTARRKRGDYTVRLDVSGTLDAPKTTLSTTPVLSESDAVSLLVTGRRMSEVSGKDAGLLVAALTDDGSDRAGDLARKIGDELGLDIGVDSGDQGGLKDSSLSIGRRLGPDLYVRYVMGVFDSAAKLVTRYRLNRLFSVEMETGKQQGADLIFRLER